MSSAIDISDIELYGFLGIQQFASDDEIKKAYRRLALKLHPDKNPEKNAAEKFQKLQKVFETLTDLTKRGEYDRRLRAREETEKRFRRLDEQSKEFKRKFDEREKAFQSAKKDTEREEREKATLVQRLREEGRKKLREEELEKERLAKEARLKAEEPVWTVVVSWKSRPKDSRPAYTDQEIRELFSTCGEISAFAKTRDKNEYTMVFNESRAALSAAGVLGKPTRPFSFRFHFKNYRTETKQGRAKFDLEELSNLSGDEPTEQELEEVDRLTAVRGCEIAYTDEKTGLPVRYVYEHGGDALFLCASTYALPADVRLRGREEFCHDGHLYRLWPHVRDRHLAEDE